MTGLQKIPPLRYRMYGWFPLDRYVQPHFGQLRLIMHELQLMLKLEEGYPFAPHPFQNVDLECTVAVKKNITHRLSGTIMRRIYGFVCRFIWLCIVYTLSI